MGLVNEETCELRKNGIVDAKVKLPRNINNLQTKPWWIGLDHFMTRRLGASITLGGFPFIAKDKIVTWKCSSSSKWIFHDISTIVISISQLMGLKFPWL
jgi:hypothetical protein